MSVDKKPPTDTKPELVSFSVEDVEHIFEQIDELKDVSNIENLQKKLHSDYKLLAKEFSESRISRVDAYLNKIEDLQARLRREYNSFESYVHQNTPTVDPSTGVSSQLTGKQSTNKFEENLLQSSSEFPPVILSRTPILDTLPIFPESFGDLIKPHKKTLEALEKQYKYESELLEQNTRKNIELVWRQSIKDKNDARLSLRTKVFQDKYAAELDYYNVVKYKKMRDKELRHRISTRKVTEKRRTSELDHISKSVSARSKSFPKVLSYPSIIPTASSSDIASDLALMNNVSIEMNISRLETSYQYLEKQEEPSMPVAVPVTMTDLVNDRLEIAKQHSIIETAPPQQQQPQPQSQSQSQIPQPQPLPQPIPQQAPVPGPGQVPGPPQLVRFQPPTLRQPAPNPTTNNSGIPPPQSSSSQQQQQPAQPQYQPENNIMGQPDILQRQLPPTLNSFNGGGQPNPPILMNPFQQLPSFQHVSGINGVPPLPPQGNFWLGSQKQ